MQEIVEKLTQEELKHIIGLAKEQTSMGNCFYPNLLSLGLAYNDETGPGGMYPCHRITPKGQDLVRFIESQKK